MAKKEGLTNAELEKLLKNEFDLTITEEEENEEKEKEQENEEELVKGTDTEDVEKPEDVIKIDEVKHELNYKGRGFKTLEDAVNFPNTDTFKRLGNADKQEYLNWLKK